MSGAPDIIGGADAPTAIFLGNGFGRYFLLAAVLLAVAAIIAIRRRKKK